MDKTPVRMKSSRIDQKLPEVDSNAKFPYIQGFPQVLRAWAGGALQNLMWGNTWGSIGGLKMVILKSR